jgi:hypothetical protein
LPNSLNLPNSAGGQKPTTELSSSKYNVQTNFVEFGPPRISYHVIVSQNETKYSVNKYKNIYLWPFFFPMDLLSNLMNI